MLSHRELAILRSSALAQLTFHAEAHTHIHTRASSDNNHTLFFRWCMRHFSWVRLAIVVLWSAAAVAAVAAVACAENSQFIAHVVSGLWAPRYLTSAAACTRAREHEHRAGFDWYAAFAYDYLTRATGFTAFSQPGPVQHASPGMCEPSSASSSHRIACVQY